MASISIPLFPLNTVLFPEGLLPLQIFEVRYLDMIHKCITDQTEFGVILLTQGREVRTPEGRERFAAMGTMARIQEWDAPMPGLLTIRCVGSTRFNIVSSEQLKHGLWVAEATPVEDDRIVEVPAELQSVADALSRLLTSAEDKAVSQNDMPILPPYRLNECGWVANRWCELLPLPNEQKQSMLALDNPLVRLELIYDVLDGHGFLAQSS